MLENQENKENQVVDFDSSSFDTFLKEVKNDYENCGPQLRVSLDKFAERYRVAKSQSIPRLSTLLYDIKRELDPSARVKSGSMIRVQVESIKRRKSEGTGARRRYSINAGVDNNSDPQAIPKRKIRKVAKKEHNLSKNISNNLLN